jgi:hypothetical protein
VTIEPWEAATPQRTVRVFPSHDPTPQEPSAPVPRVRLLALAAACLASILASPAPADATTSAKVAIIVGPVGSLTPTYLHLAEAAAAAAEARGARVARAYSPNATPANVLAAVADADIVIYFGHGYGNPSPYGGFDPAKQNGWALQGPNARGTHADSSANGSLAYYGEDWIVANARPARGFAMIYSNTCYAPGASEGGDPAATPLQAAERVSGYSRPVFALGGSAYFATDFDLGAAALVDRLLATPAATYGSAFWSDHRFVPGALTIQPHWFAAGQQVWLHRTVYSGRTPNYWYAFAGNPDATPARSWDRTAPILTLEQPPAGGAPVDATLTLHASEQVRGISATTVRLVARDGGSPLAATVSLAADGTTITLGPASPLSVGARFVVSVSAGVTDLAGNPAAAAKLSLATRRDADPWEARRVVALDSGTHVLVRLAVDGAVVERTELELIATTGLSVAERARLAGLDGSWLRIAGGTHAGWWVAESSAAHLVGVSERVGLEPSGTVAIEPGRQLFAGLDVGAPQRLDRVVIPSEAGEPQVDQRVVVDGRGYARISTGSLADTWIEVAAAFVPEGSRVVRSAGLTELPEGTSAAIDAGDLAAYRFDADGRVTHRAAVEIAADASLAVDRRMEVGGQPFIRLASGELSGSWIAESESVRLVPADGVIRR